jgi:hypothetical protein
LTQIEIGAQSLPDSAFNEPDTPLEDYSLSKSIEIIKHLRQVCQERGYACSVKDERQFDPDDPFIAFHISDGVLGNFSVHLSDLSGIDIYDEQQRGIFEPYDYHSIYPNPIKPDDFKSVALQIIDIIEKASVGKFDLGRYS